ncbi:MAG: hypothetical protein CMK07_01910 [Ponticaulis sp.]|nr:hypothetical protein [Ponticaulis sp.]
MLRDLASRQMDHDPRFTWRGDAVTRIENLSDIVFALALGMLVSSAERPTTFDDLSGHLLTIIPVAAGFAVLFSVWNAHFTYFRRYGVADGMIIFLNCVLLLFVLFVAYPLRFIFDGLFGYVYGMITQEWDYLQDARLTFRTSGIVMGYFTVGYALIYGVISLMYAHALSKAEMLELTAVEKMMTRQSIIMFIAIILISLTTGALAVFTSLGAFAGCLMGVLGPMGYVVKFLARPKDVSEGAADNA